jgi:hypothetical protein
MSKRVAKNQGKARGKAGRGRLAAGAALVERAERELTDAMPSKPRDSRLPNVGTILAKERGQETHEVTVLVEGFEYRGETYRSLSKIARLITGVTWNGYAFFGLNPREQTKSA